MILTRLANLLEKARHEAVSGKRSVFVSLSERIAFSDPLAALETAVRLSPDDERFRKQLEAGSVYWARQSDGFTFAGIGAVATLTPSGQDRFDIANESWQSLLQSSLLDDDGEVDPAVGPILTGGFAFDDAGPRSDKWEGFPASHLIVPRILVTSSNGTAWLTVTSIVGADGDVDADMETIRSLCETMIGSATSDAAVKAGENGKGNLEYSQPLPESSWAELVRLALGEIRSGVLDKVVVARELHGRSSQTIDLFALLRFLQSRHPESFVFAYSRGNRVFAGASPERLVRVEGESVLTSSVAGTITRDADPGRDSLNAQALLDSDKDQAEHAIVRDAIHAHLLRQCDDVSAPGKASLMMLRHVYHLHTPFRARLKPGASLLSLVRELHPTPAVGGSPRGAALSFIREHEQIDRGWYASPIGWVGRHGGEFAVALRSALIESRDAVLYAGCGIIADSDPTLEYNESSLKMRSMQRALDAASA